MEPQLVPVSFEEITQMILCTSFEGLLMQVQKKFSIPPSSKINLFDWNNGAEISDDIFELYVQQYKSSPLFKIRVATIQSVCSHIKSNCLKFFI